MSSYKLKKDKEGQIGKALPWIIATITIIIFLFVFTSISYSMSVGDKLIHVGDLKLDLGEKANLLAEKTALANALANNKNKEQIDKILSGENS